MRSAWAKTLLPVISRLLLWVGYGGQDDFYEAWLCAAGKLQRSWITTEFRIKDLAIDPGGSHMTWALRACFSDPLCYDERATFRLHAFRLCLVPIFCFLLFVQAEFMSYNDRHAYGSVLWAPRTFIRVRPWSSPQLELGQSDIRATTCVRLPTLRISGYKKGRGARLTDEYCSKEGNLRTVYLSHITWFKLHHCLYIQSLSCMVA